MTISCLSIGRDWSNVDLDDSKWVAVIELDPADQYLCRWVAVRGGRTTRHFSKQEAEIAGRRVEAEIGGRFVSVVQFGTWKAWATPGHSLADPLTLPGFLAYLLPGEEAHRAIRQYKDDPLVTGQSEEV